MDKFIQLVEEQCSYGGKKYAHNKQREATDILFEKHGKNWLFGTIDKYTFRYGNLKRERDLLKIGCYMFLIWIKRGFFLMPKGVDTPIDTNVTIKSMFFPAFIERYKDSSNSDRDKLLKKYEPMKVISYKMGAFSKAEWTEITEDDIMSVFNCALKEWDKEFKNTEKHDTDCGK